jgi:hypothetical protein
MSIENGCLVTVEGNYFALAGSVDRKKVKKPYKITVRVAAPEAALSVIKNKLLDRVLARKYNDYHTYHTHEITGLTDLQGHALMGYTNVRIMNFNQIADYIRAKGLPLKLELYTDLDTLRTMVFLAESNETEFIRKQAVLEIEAKEDALLARLNPELFDKAHPINVPAVTEVPNIEPSKKIQDQRETMTWDEKQKKYIPSKDYVEDFTREDEKPYGANVDDEILKAGDINQNPPAQQDHVSQVGETAGAVTVNQTPNLMDEL